MKFYLSSYKFGTEDTKIVLKEWIKENGNKIAFISNSRDARENTKEKFEKIEADKKLLKEIGFEVFEIDLKNYFGNYEKLENDLKDFKVFCLIGGNVFVLRKAMFLSGFDKFVKKRVYDDNYLYIGYSAGICLLGKTLEGLDLVDEPINPYNSDDVLYEGLDILEDTLVPHYKSNHPESEAVDKVVEYLENKNIKYETLHDGDVIITEFRKEKLTGK